MLYLKAAREAMAHDSVSRKMQQESDESAWLTSSGLVFRTPQKKKCSMGLFAISYDFGTQSATALNLSYAFDLEQFGTLPSNALRTLIDQLIESRAQWGHPLFLPCIFLVAHAARVKSYINGTIGSEIAIVKDCVGVTRAGTSQKAFLTQTYAADEGKLPKLFVDGRLQRQDAKRLTEKINDLSTSIIYAKRSPLWDAQVAKFLLGILGQDEEVRKSDEAASKMFKETLEYVSNFSEGCLEEAESAEAQMKLQLEIVGDQFFAPGSPRPLTDIVNVAVHFDCPRRRPNQCPASSFRRQRQHFDEDHRSHRGCVSAWYFRSGRLRWLILSLAMLMNADTT